MVQKIVGKVVSPVHVGQALESLRNSDFDALSAIGEAIDNSLEAKAKSIRIRTVTEVPKGKRKEHIVEFAFGDDGRGMDEEILHHCLQLGYSTSYNDRKGIGRFGVGMTLAAISLCKRIEVYSKNKGGEWRYTYLDLDEIKGQTNPVIPLPARKDIPKEYASLVGEPGTLVIWKNIDRITDDLEDIEYWIGRTYRKFIGEETIDSDKIVPNREKRKIYLNDQLISAYDPLYVTRNQRFPDEPRARLAKPQTLEYAIPTVDAPPGKSAGTSIITIRYSLLPEKWRPHRGSGGSAENNARRVYENEGISILRNNREVFYGKLYPFEIPEGFKDLDRFWGCEISFNAELDHWFSVKNIKVGAHPIPELRRTLGELMTPTVITYRNAIRKVWDEFDKKNVSDTGGALSGTDAAEKALKKTLEGTKQVSKEQKEKDIDAALEKSALNMRIKKAAKEKAAEVPIVIVKDDQADSRGPFIDITAEGSATFLTLNMNHPLFIQLNSITDQIEKAAKKKKPEDKDLIHLARKLNARLQLLVSTFAIARNTIIQENSQAEDIIEKMILNWTFFLRKALGNLSDNKD